MEGKLMACAERRSTSSCSAAANGTPARCVGCGLRHWRDVPTEKIPAGAAVAPPDGPS